MHTSYCVIPPQRSSIHGRAESVKLSQLHFSGTHVDFCCTNSSYGPNTKFQKLLVRLPSHVISLDGNVFLNALEARKGLRNNRNLLKTCCKYKHHSMSQRLFVLINNFVHASTTLKDINPVGQFSNYLDRTNFMSTR